MKEFNPVPKHKIPSKNKTDIYIYVSSQLHEENLCLFIHQYFLKPRFLQVSILKWPSEQKELFFIPTTTTINCIIPRYNTHTFIN